MEGLLDPGRRFVKESFCEEWVYISDELSKGPTTVGVPVLHNTDHSEHIPVTPRTSKQFTSLPWVHPKLQDKAFLGTN